MLLYSLSCLFLAIGNIQAKIDFNEQTKIKEKDKCQNRKAFLIFTYIGLPIYTYINNKNVDSIFIVIVNGPLIQCHKRGQKARLRVLGERYHYSVIYYILFPEVYPLNWSKKGSQSDQKRGKNANTLLCHL